MAAVAGSFYLPTASVAARLVARRSAAGLSFRRPLATTISGESKQPQLVLYTKPGCCLCEGLKEKLDAALCLGGGGPESLRSVRLEVRDISGNPEWERLYQYEIPVLAKLLPDGREEALPRLSPRLGVELIQKKIAAALLE